MTSQEVKASGKTLRSRLPESKRHLQAVASKHSPCGLKMRGNTSSKLLSRETECSKVLVTTFYSVSDEYQERVYLHRFIYICPK